MKVYAKRSRERDRGWGGRGQVEDATARTERREGGKAEHGHDTRNVGAEEDSKDRDFLLSLRSFSGKGMCHSHSEPDTRVSWLHRRAPWLVESLSQSLAGIRQTGAQHLIPLFSRASSYKMKFHAQSNFGNI